jgi:hypothetical protein
LITSQPGNRHPLISYLFVLEGDNLVKKDELQLQPAGLEQISSALHFQLSKRGKPQHPVAAGVD